MSREANEMKDLLTTIVTALVSRPEMVRIDHHDQAIPCCWKSMSIPTTWGKSSESRETCPGDPAIMKAKATKCDKRSSWISW